MQRFEELDSLRGLAALAVMIGHFFLVFIPMGQNTSNLGFIEYPLNILKYTPLHAFWGGHEAVIMFFLLSGFVLSLPFFNNRQQPYMTYFMKRICRIYIPFVVALFAAMLLREAVYETKLMNLTSYHNNLWVIPPNFQSVLDHLLFVGNYNSIRFVPILWTLVHEMRISLLFPILMFIVIKGGWKIGLPLAIGLSVGAELLLEAFEPHYMTNYVMSLHYASFFIIGALLAMYREALKRMYTRFNGWVVTLLFAAALCCYSFKWVGYGSDFHEWFVWNRADWPIALGASWFIVAAVSSTRISKQLHWKPLLFLGKTSYSLYLYHMIMLLTLLHLLNGLLATEIIVLLAFALSFAAASLSYYFIELPSIRLGKWLTRSHKQPAVGVGSGTGSAGGVSA